jgi:hypothetical protein
MFSAGFGFLNLLAERLHFSQSPCEARCQSTD